MRDAVSSSDEPEWVTWEATTSQISLTDGRSVTVSFGDTLLVEQTEIGLVVHDHHARTLN